MSLVDGLRKLPTPMITLHIFSKVLIGIGIGSLFANFIVGVEWWLIIGGIILSVPPAIGIFKRK